jgi:hypothetical protein
LPRGFFNKILYVFFFSCICATCPAHYNLTVLWEERNYEIHPSWTKLFLAGKLFFFKVWNHAWIEALVISGNKFLYACVKQVCCHWTQPRFDTFHEPLIIVEPILRKTCDSLAYLW